MEKNAGLGGRASLRPRGLEQFAGRGRAGDVGYCVAGAAPYALDFENENDVICLLLGDIRSQTQFDADTAAPVRFAGQTAAFHPRGGRVSVVAEEVQRGFIAFDYAPRFQTVLDDRDCAGMSRDGSRINVRRGSIAALSRYALGRLRSREAFSVFEMQSLASLVFLETLRGLSGAESHARRALSEREFDVICQVIDARLGDGLTCAEIAAIVGLPLRVVFDGVKQRTGLSLYRFVIERRLEKAEELLRRSGLTISEIALSCGFSSQQHLTTAFAGKRGHTPSRFRRTV